MDRTTLAAAVPLLGVAILAWKHASAPKRLPLPPGPNRRPLIGNLLDLPAENPWLTYHEWAKTYGDVLSVEVLGQPIIIVASAAAAEELFDRRSAIYSDRPRLVMITELMGFDFTFAMSRYGDMWREKRRMLHKYVNHKVSPEYQGMQSHEAHKFVAKLLEDPQDFMTQVNQYIIRTITSVVYGMHNESDIQHFAAIGQETMDYATEAAVPGKYLVDIIPAMKYIPAWFPGASFQRTATHVRQLVQEMLDKPWKTVQDDLATGSALPSMTMQMIRNGEDESLAKANAGAVYVAGLDTTHSAVGSFFFALTKYPDVRKRAQAELDTIVGPSRLPEFADGERLPYIRALISEIFRRYPVTPWAVPHATIAEDMYNGYRIPKGSIVIGNVWSMLNNPEDYPEPEAFNPERFLKIVNGRYEYDESVRDPRTVEFGFGRRICPGRFIAEQSLYAAVVTVLATCDISAPLDADGNAELPEENFTTGMVMGPKPFRCVIKPRSKEAVELVQFSLPGDNSA